MDFLTIQYDVGNKPHVLDLKLNRELLPNGYFRKYQKNGQHVIDRPTIHDVDLCHYQGKLRGVADSWAAISTCEGGIKGVVYDGKELNHIEKAHDDLEGFSDRHYLYKHSDLIESTNKSCGYHGDAHRDKGDKGDERLNRVSFKLILY